MRTAWDGVRTVLTLGALALLSGCGTAWKTNATDSRSQTPALPAAPPVTFRFLGLTPDDAYLHYAVSVNTTRPIAEVDIAVWQDDFPAGVATYVWRNAVAGKPQPIHAGRLYDVYDMAWPNARLVDARLIGVVFKDGGHWAP